MNAFRSFLAVSAATVALTAVYAPATYAQETTSSLRGTVTSEGAPVANATVEVTHVPSGTKASTTTNADGSFVVNALRIGGPFLVRVTATDFDEFQASDVYTVVGTPYDLPVEMTATGNVIVVTARSIKGAGVKSQGPSTVLTTADVAKVASVNRDIRDLMRRDPFARLDDSPGGGRAVSFAGQNARYNRFSVDGVGITDNFGLNADGLPSRRSPIPLDAIGQFQAKVAPYDVREGNFQGGAINIVLRSGTNDFQGTGFYAFSSDKLVGSETKPGPGIPTGKTAIPSFKIENFGAELSGPIIKDKLFFMIAGERLRGGRPISEGPGDNNAGTAIPNLTQAQVDQVSQIAKNVYGYDTGGVLRNLGDKDDRLVAKIDANISDTQRLSLTYTYAEDAINLLNNTFSSTTSGPPGLGLASNAYIQGNRLHTGVVQLNSQWSDDFSTEVRGFYKKYKRLQDPVLGRGFAQFRVCTNPTSTPLTVAGSSPTNCENNAAVVSFGPDSSRQTNALDTESFGGLFQIRLTKHDHDMRAFVEVTNTKVVNAFLQNTAGTYYFDSLQDLQDRKASSFGYGNAVPSLNPDAASAAFSYQLYTFGIMDSWRVTPTLNFSYGARFDMYGGYDHPAFSAAFARTYGDRNVLVDGNYISVPTNTTNLNGLSLFQPRFGFDWKATPRLKVRGGGGIFGGGAPDVYVSNSFSNTGFLTNSISISRTASGGISGAPAGAACLPVGTAMDGVTGTNVGNAANNCLASTTASALSSTNVMDPKFKLPSQWRATISADYEANLGPLGDGWFLGADLLYSKVRDQVYFTDIRLAPVAGANGLTPDGRIRYQNILDTGATSSNTSNDILLTNTSRGRALIGVLRFDKAWDFGLSLSGSFTYQDVKDQAPATSSTAGSNYSNGAFLDANNVAYGTSNDEVKYFFKYSAAYEHSFFGDNKTTLALFGETRSGHPFSYTFQDFGSGRSAVFGVTGRSTATGTAGNRYLLYVPTAGDSRVSYSSAEFQNAFMDFVNRSGLSKYAGGIAPRNAFRSKWFTRIDLHASQEIPVPFTQKSKFTLFADIENFTNLLNSKWGQQREYVFPYNAAVVQVQCLQAAAPTGTAGLPAANVSQPCAQYRYSPVNNAAGFTDPVDQVYVNQSLYSIRLGVRFSF